MKITILGGGLSGMSAAYKLYSEHEVTIIEKEKILGGLASSFEKNKKFIPRYYHHIFHNDKITIDFMKKFGITLKFKKIKMAILADKKLYNFTDPLSLLKFDYLSFSARLRYGIFGAYVFFLMNPEKIKDTVNAKEWLIKYAGKEVSQKLFHELYAVNKFNIPLEEISAKQFANRLKAKEALGKFGYPDCGLQEFINRFENYLTEKGVKIIKNKEIKKIKKGLVELEGEKIESDIIINTLPPPILLKITDNLPESYRKKLEKIDYCPAVCITYSMKNFLSPHYWLNIIKEKCHIIIQHSILFDNYENKIGWVLRYGGSIEDFNLTDEQIKEKYLSIVKKYFPKAEFIWSTVTKDRYAEPIYNKDYINNKPDYRTPLNWLYNAGVSVTFPKVRTMNTALESGLKVVEIIKEDLIKK